MYSHRAFRAKFAVRVVLAGLGAAAGQGSIKWWCLRHRLHHRYMDDPLHDPYAATRGLFFSHIGWLFYKPVYERIHLVDGADLESDPVVRFQHKYFVPLAFSLGFGLPALLGGLLGDASGGFVWAGLVARLATWHGTFLVNSLCHWNGIQPYSDEDSSKGNLLLAVVTNGEGNHNFQHTFPYDWRAGPGHIWSWDPCGWIIYVLYCFGLVSDLRTSRESDVREAMVYMASKNTLLPSSTTDDTPWGGETWNIRDAQNYVDTKPGRCLVLIDDYFVDVTRYLGEHPGGASLLRKYSIGQHDVVAASWAFDGGLNNHSRSARRRMAEFRLARFCPQA
ncbi:hypothetical protein C8R43DRAFT_1057713 [Mycena crocata]|nr:hypothetical protein C8R43DRAFT_1057713 [Mycena crocata]